jgi:hypothetical protein
MASPEGMSGLNLHTTSWLARYMLLVTAGVDSLEPGLSCKDLVPWPFQAGSGHCPWHARIWHTQLQETQGDRAYLQRSLSRHFFCTLQHLCMVCSPGVCRFTCHTHAYCASCRTSVMRLTRMPAKHKCGSIRSWLHRTSASTRAWQTHASRTAWTCVHTSH